MTTICPNCHYHELEGAIFCSECGTKLIEQSGLSTAAIRGTDSILKPQSKINQSPPPEPAVDALASLHIISTGQILPLIGREEFSIGRISEGQSILPDIDLTPYEAYSRGVSRLHATLKIHAEKISITDLGSSNGTRLNNEKIEAHKEYFINHGDVITLGKFKLQALLRQD